MVNNWLNIIQNYALPPTCILCDSPGYQLQDLCLDCHQSLPRLQHSCAICALDLANETMTPPICGQCQRLKPAFDSTIAAYRYTHSMQYLITQLKFNAQYKNARLLGQLLAEKVRSTNTALPQAIIPVPLHPKRYRERTFNQCIEIGRTLSQQLHIPLLTDVCSRQRDTEHQTALNRQQRLKNLQHAFVLQRPLALQHITLLDDVMTTGATLHAIADILKQQGVTRVDTWVCARA